MNKEYQDYLKSPEWQGKRQLFYARAGHRCQLCNAEGELHAHHRTYERVGNEHPDDVTVLCADCHAKFHGIEPRKAVPINCVSHVFKELWGFISLMEEKGARIVPSPDGGLQLMVDGEIRTTFNHYGMEAWISLCAKLISVSMEFDMFYQHLCDEGFENTAEAAAQDNLEVIEERCEARRTDAVP